MMALRVAVVLAVVLASTSRLHATTEECFDGTPFTSIEDPVRNGTFRSSTILLSLETTFTCSGQVSSFQALMEGAVQYELVVFQVWRPTSNCTYTLSGEQRVENYSVTDNYLLDSALVTPPLDPVLVEPGDVLGVYVRQGEAADYGVQERTGQGNTLFEITASPDASELDLCSAEALGDTGVPNVNAIVEEDADFEASGSALFPSSPLPSPTSTSDAVLLLPYSSSMPPSDPPSSSSSSSSLPSSSVLPTSSSLPTSSPSSSFSHTTTHPLPSPLPSLTSTQSQPILETSSTIQRVPSSASSLFTVHTTVFPRPNATPTNSLPAARSTVPVARESTVAGGSSQIVQQTPTAGPATKPSTNTGPSSSVVAVVVVVLLIIVAVTAAILGLGIYLVKKKRKTFHLDHSVFLSTGPGHVYETAPRNLFKPLKGAELEESGTYAKVGPPDSMASSLCETNLDFTVFRNARTPDMFGAEYEAAAPPMAGVTSPTRNQFDTLPTLPRSRSLPRNAGRMIRSYNILPSPNIEDSPPVNDKLPLFHRSHSHSRLRHLAINNAAALPIHGQAWGEVPGIEIETESCCSEAYDTPMDAMGNIRDRRLATPIHQLTVPAGEQRDSGVYDIPMDTEEDEEGGGVATPPLDSDHTQEQHIAEKRESHSESESTSQNESDILLRQGGGASNTKSRNIKSLIDEEEEYVKMASALVYVNQRAQGDENN